MDKIKKDALLSVRHLTVEYTSEGEVIHAVNDVSLNLKRARPSVLSVKRAQAKRRLQRLFCGFCPSRLRE